MDLSPTRLVAGLDPDPIRSQPAEGHRLAGEAVRGRMEILKLQFEYAWRAWHFNAGQRISVFQFFITLTTGTTALFGVLVQQHWLAGTAAGLFGMLLSVVFLLLDRRNEELVRASEDLLHELEKQAIFGDAKFRPKQRSRRWPLGLPGETLSEDLEVPLGLRSRVAEEECLRKQALSAPANAAPIGDRVRWWLRKNTAIGLTGESPYRFGFWLPAIDDGGHRLPHRCPNLFRFFPAF
jgi:hypothetical protein